MQKSRAWKLKICVDKTIFEALIPVMVMASNMDYIIKGVKGEFYPCKPDVFKMTYERIEDESKHNLD